MIVISQGMVETFEASLKAGFSRRLHAWWCQNVDPHVVGEKTERLLFIHKVEFDLVGVADEEDCFLFLYARELMPKMGDHDYLETMDAIFSRRVLKERVAEIAAIAQRFVHHG